MKTLMATMALFLTILVSNAWADLTGRWSCDDGGTYYLRQSGQDLFWYGKAEGERPAWTNVFHGRIHQGRITGTWADVPKGRARNAGKLELRLSPNGRILKAVQKTGGFGGSRWSRAQASARPAPPPPPTLKEDCVSFDPAAVRVRKINGNWKIVDGSHWLFDFGDDRSAARQTLRIIRHYRMDQSCFVGRPDPSFTYMLTDGNAPAGAVNGEDCVAFDPDRITVRKLNGRWKIVDGSHWLFDFDQNEAEARQTLHIIRKHGFTRSCFVGRPDPDFTYLRR